MSPSLYISTQPAYRSSISPVTEFFPVDSQLQHAASLPRAEDNEYTTSLIIASPSPPPKSSSIKFSHFFFRPSIPPCLTQSLSSAITRRTLSPPDRYPHTIALSPHPAPPSPAIRATSMPLNEGDTR
ncbi:hypothetical protein E2C01_048793 [Portunus trituberculatus]|uniref:Uncharacterized protein n=1 Tax=Portunus trituberculatus TaxID=210409 RepID=A0A5B7GEB8_PORTR|nr:hypothetical protein [Portunus trituberculatus]